MYYKCSVQIDSHGSPFCKMSALLLHNWISVFFLTSRSPVQPSVRFMFCFTSAAATPAAVRLPGHPTYARVSGAASPNEFSWLETATGERTRLSSPWPDRIDRNTASTDGCVWTDRASAHERTNDWTSELNERYWTERTIRFIVMLYYN